ncbi:hypothetical protein DPX16_23794 [Anabarilius grahami]|uniref:Uncharacterized protein n=1 Tax=Anabarilius grahami TaxID=495550 RepID=A0A3N0YN72_ANAGA|nr:hypothetical protein DPX16_23794 [Anabarilius grahami]
MGKPPLTVGWTFSNWGGALAASDGSSILTAIGRIGRVLAASDGSSILAAIGRVSPPLAEGLMFGKGSCGIRGEFNTRSNRTGKPPLAVRLALVILDWEALMASDGSSILTAIGRTGRILATLDEGEFRQSWAPAGTEVTSLLWQWREKARETDSLWEPRRHHCCGSGEKKPEKLSPCGSRGDITAVAVEKLARRTDLREPRGHHCCGSGEKGQKN